MFVSRNEEIHDRNGLIITVINNIVIVIKDRKVKCLILSYSENNTQFISFLIIWKCECVDLKIVLCNTLKTNKNCENMNKILIDMCVSLLFF